jgi:aminoglycoside phosphotransferase (APT) family kinase protein
VHGSFKFSHIFLADAGVAFIDFDGASLGDPGYDLGRFIAHLQEMKATRRLPAPVADAAVEGFSAGYRRGSRHEVSERRIRWYAASHILCSQIYKGVKRFDPGPAEALFPLAEEVCPQP